MSKTVTVIVLRADRQIWDGGELRLKITDLRDGLRVLRDVTVPGTSNIIEVNLDVPFDAGQIYGLQVDSEDHRAAWRFIRRRDFLRQENGQTIELDHTIFRLLLVPNNPRSADLNQGWVQLNEQEESPTVVGAQPWPQDRFNAMGDREKMAFLNIDAKLRDTRINGVPIRSFVEGVSHVAPARAFLFVRPELKDLVRASNDFDPAQGHGAPSGSMIPLPSHPDSWKHKLFVAGNVQLSFSASTMPLPMDATKRVYSVDADIDLESGFLHALEWLHNEVFKPGQKTDQTRVYALLFAQGIIPRYSLEPLLH